MPEFKAFTLKGKGVLNQLKTQCGVSDAIDLSDPGANPIIKSYEAIWDTGATGTVITSKVASDLGLKPTGVITSNHAGGVSEVNTYLINVYLPNGINVIGLKVIEGILAGNVEMLIGMDIISLGDFAFTNYNGEACFSFRIPSIKQIDYVEQQRAQMNPSGSNFTPPKKKRKKRK